MPQQKIHSTTQEFTEILDIIDGVAFFKGNNACVVLEISSINFYLLTRDEQDARIFAYMSLLNSLSFYIQILIVSKKVNLANYLKLLDQKIAQEKNEKILHHLTMYLNFMKGLLKGEELLDKKTFIVIPFTQLELGPVSETKKALKKQTSTIHLLKTKEALMSKKNQVITQLQRMGLYAKQLTTEELIRLFYELFNQESMNFDYQEGDIKNIIL